MTAREIISGQAVRAMEVVGHGLDNKKRKHFIKFFEDVCLSENWIKIEHAIMIERGNRETP